MCGANGHGKDTCEITRGLINNDWIHFDDRNALVWGPKELPQGRVGGLPKGGPWDAVILSDIKRRWLKADKDPLTTKATFIEDT